MDDHVKHGSVAHAALIGLRKAVKDEEFQLDGWAMVDMTAFGPQATSAYIQEVLRQKVSELNTKPPAVQSKDSRKPHYAPPAWDPDA